MTATITKKRKTTAKKKTPSRERESAESRRGLWVVVSGRMKQYGDLVIERPGQVIRPAYLRNDEVLLKHNYVKPLKKHEDITTCDRCGSTFLGDAISGPYQNHLADARHDLNKLDLDSGAKGKDGRKKPVGDNSEDPDSDGGGEWDLEDEGASPPTKMDGSGAVTSL